MKADISRQTFDSNKRYSGVVMQQGRVQLDAEWNEQQEIHQHRTQTGTGEVIGPSGTPLGEDGRATGFEITAQNGKLRIGGGRIFVDGVLCVNESEVPLPYDEQPDPPAPGDLTGWMEEDEDGGDVRLGLAYLDVWERHVTHFDDARIREVALGGPDTTTRKQTVWQVKVMTLDTEDVAEGDLTFLADYARLRAESDPSEAEELEEISARAVKILGTLCRRGEEELDTLREPATGDLRARAKEDGAAGPCQIPPGGGYTRLENQLYRVEIHRPGNRATARFKWSRDNGSVVTGIENIDVEKKEITVRDTGRDEFSRLAPDQWVEVADDRTELEGRPRELLQIDDVDHARRIVTVIQTPPDFDDIESHHPKLRRWDQSGDGATENGVELDEQELDNDGIEVGFGSGLYRAGDYWLIPARTATGDIEWPPEDPEDPNSDPEALPPHGVRHGLCALAIVAAVPEDGDSEDSNIELAALHDCRNPFPQLTKLTSFFYLGGDGQEAMPGNELPEPLRVGVANGQWPVEGARVRFETDNGALKNADGSPGRDEDGNPDEETVVVLTGADGVAACRWTLDEENQSQRVTARLLDVEDDGGDGTLHLPIHFSANLSVAREVAYDPGDCKNLQEDAETTVQTAMDRLSHLSSLYYLSGDGQHVSPDDVKELEPLRVLVANDCGPVGKATVTFEVREGNGGLQDGGDSFETETDEEGIASCEWQLDDQTPVQRATATLKDAAGNRTRGPTSFVFTATLNKSQAKHVTYDPANCEFLAEVDTVQEAIDQLCQREGGLTERGFHVKVVTRLLDDAPVRNGGEMFAHEFMRGLRIVFDQELNPETVNPATCFVTLDIPWPLTGEDRQRFDIKQVVGGWPLILRSVLEPGENELLWHPEDEESITALLRLLSAAARRVPAHLTLKGNSIMAKGERDVYLDGDVFGDPQEDLGMHLPSGDGRRGGDFEMYLWLITERNG